MPKKQPEPTFWLNNNRYFMLTGEIWQKSLHVALSGETPEKVCEHLLADGSLKDAEQIEPRTVPLEWWRAFHALCKHIPANPPAKPQPAKPQPAKPQPEGPTPAETMAAEEEMLLHIAAGTDLFTAGLAAADSFRKKSLKPINGPCPLSFFSGMLVVFVFFAVAWLLWQ